MSRCNHVEFSKCLRDVPNTFRALRNEERIAHGEGLRLPFRIRNGHRSREDRHHFMDRVALKLLLAGRVLPNLSLPLIPSEPSCGSIGPPCVAWLRNLETERDRSPVDDEAPGTGRPKMLARWDERHAIERTMGHRA